MPLGWAVPPPLLDFPLSRANSPPAHSQNSGPSLMNQQTITRGCKSYGHSPLHAQHRIPGFAMQTTWNLLRSFKLKGGRFWLQWKLPACALTGFEHVPANLVGKIERKSAALVPRRAFKHAVILPHKPSFSSAAGKPSPVPPKICGDLPLPPC